ncbi:MAG TPA: hypothetical protein VGB77_22165 [Abditibacteriaceae bacterium]|jgi:hypothetical protein
MNPNHPLVLQRKQQQENDQEIKAPRLVTEEFDLAVALLCIGWKSPELIPNGYGRNNKLRVKFSFPMEAGQTQHAVEDKYLRKEMRSEISHVFTTSRDLKARIYRLSKNLNDASGEKPGGKPVAESESERR